MFTEENTVEQMLLETLSGTAKTHPDIIAEEVPPFSKAKTPWQYLPADQINRQYSDVFVEEKVRAAPKRSRSN